MMMFIPQGLVYLAIPKTATTAIERALSDQASLVLRDPPGLKHTNAKGFERRFRTVFQRNHLPTLETLAVMREPVDWLGSWYRYRQRHNLNDHPNSTAGKSFDQFVAAYLSDVQPAYAKIGCQARFVTDKTGKVLIDHLYPYEQLDRCISFLETRLKLKISLDVVNTSPVAELKLSKSLKADLLKKHAADFEIHGAL